VSSKGEKTFGDNYLLINATNTKSVTDLDSSDVWEPVSLQANDTDKEPGVTLQRTLCFTVFEAQDMEIEAKRAIAATQELALTYNTSTATYNTKDVLRQWAPENQT
jgi:hypothetical protein